jgi:heptosyltransferase-2
MGKISQFGPEKADQLKKENKLTHTAIFSRILGIQISRPLFFGSSVINTLIGDQMSSEFFRIGINSGSGGRWESKRLPIPETIDLIIRLLKYSIMGKNVFIELLGGVDEQERNFKIKDTFKSNNLVRVFESSDSILHFSALVSNCNYIITSDSLAMHLAIAQSVPNLTFFAPTSAVEIDTFGTGVKVVSTSPEYCNYKSDSDNSSITADRIFGTFIHHLSLLKLPCVKKFC